MLCVNKRKGRGRAICASVARVLTVGALVACGQAASAAPFPDIFNLYDADVRISGAEFGDRCGRCMTSPGDVNADGLDDILIGVPGRDIEGKDETGATYLFYGRSGNDRLSGTLSLADADATFLGVSERDAAGYVGPAGDVNGDGLDDFLIGAPGADPSAGRTRAGQVHLVYGKGGPSAWSGRVSLTESSTIFHGVYWNDGAGRPVDSAGDLNGDGLDDIVIAARQALPEWGDDRMPQMYVYYGRSPAEPLSGALELADADAIFQSGTRFGRPRLAGPGDLNADGIDDLVLADFEAKAGWRDEAGQVYVFYGGRGDDAIEGWQYRIDADAVLNGVGTDDHAGQRLSMVGDVNADGLNDLAIEASGQAYVVFGAAKEAAPSGSVLLSDADVHVSGGGELANAGDVNGDGINDLLFGSRDGFVDRSGVVYLIFGREDFPVETSTEEADVTFIGPYRGDTGTTVALADLDGDGFDDILMGDPESGVRGKTLVVYGVPEPGTLSLLALGVWAMFPKPKRWKQSPCALRKASHGNHSVSAN